MVTTLRIPIFLRSKFKRSRYLFTSPMFHGEYAGHRRKGNYIKRLETNRLCANQRAALIRHVYAFVVNQFSSCPGAITSTCTKHLFPQTSTAGLPNLQPRCRLAPSDHAVNKRGRDRLVSSPNANCQRKMRRQHDAETQPKATQRGLLSRT